MLSLLATRRYTRDIDTCLAIAGALDRPSLRTLRALRGDLEARRQAVHEVTAIKRILPRLFDELSAGIVL